jgi:hypothetical protein
VVVNAAVNQKNHNLWAEQLIFQKRLCITCSRQDFNLKGVRILTKDGKQLGEKIKEPLATNAQYVNFSKAAGFRFPTGTTHIYFIGEVPDKSINVKSFSLSWFMASKLTLMPRCISIPRGFITSVKC